MIQVEKLILAHNKVLAEKVILDARLKDFEVKNILPNQTEKELMTKNMLKLKSLRDEYKSNVQSLKDQQSDPEVLKVKQNYRYSFCFYKFHFFGFLF